MGFFHNLLGKINGKVLIIICGVVLLILAACVVGMLVTMK